MAPVRAYAWTVPAAAPPRCAGRATLPRAGVSETAGPVARPWSAVCTRERGCRGSCARLIRCVHAEMRPPRRQAPEGPERAPRTARGRLPEEAGGADGGGQP